jgi:hypothetical protein
MKRRTGWLGFAYWVPAGALLTLTVAAAPSFGLLLLPPAVLAIVLTARRARSWPEVLGAGDGAGAVLLAIAAINGDHRSCSAGHVLVLAPGERSAECGGLAPMPFLVIGLVVCIGAAVTHLVLMRRPEVGART